MTMDELVIDLGQQIPQTNYNAPIYGVPGEYTLAPGITVPYLNSNLEIERVIQELKTYDQIPPTLDAVWSLKDLYQREIDYKRIDREIVNGYLKDAHKLKFFNAITILLFPINTELNSDNFSDYLGNDPIVPYGDSQFDKNFAIPQARKTIFGGVQYITASIFGRLRWDHNRVVAVAVDGQHRLCALRRWHESKNATLERYEKGTKVPVIFLLLHASVGFQSKQDPNSSSLRNIAREIFTDLNKNAKQVDDAREIILDDRSLTALCARKLVTTETCKDDQNLLALSLVRWQEANNRFDQSYYLNSLLNLHQLVEMVLELNVPKDPLDQGAVESFIESLNESLGGPSKELHDGQMSIKAFYEKNYLGDDGPTRPMLHLPETYLNTAIGNFCTIHRPYMLRTLTGFKPYRILLDYAREHELITGFFARWFAQPEGHKTQLKAQIEKRHGQHWQKQMIEQHIEAIQKIKGHGESDNWTFKVVFQKALIQLVRTIEFEHGSAKDRLGTVDDVIRVMNALYDKGFFLIQKKVAELEPFRLWTFLATHPTTTKIKVTKKTVNILHDILLLTYYANRKYEVDVRDSRSPTTDCRQLIRFFSSETSQGEKPPILWPGCKDAADNLVKLFAPQAHLWTKIPDGEKGPDRRQKEARSRLAGIVREACVSFSPDVEESERDVP